METPATSSPPSQVPCVGPIQGPGTSVGRITIITSLADLVTRAVMTTNDQPVAPHLCSPLVEGHGLEVPDTFIVIDPDDSAFGVVRPEARMLRSSAAANSAAVALGTESAASSVDGPALGVGDQPTPKVETQPHTGDIAPEPVLGVPSSEKTPHEAKEPPTSGSASVDGVFDPAISLASISGVMHQIGDIGQHGCDRRVRSEQGRVLNRRMLPVHRRSSREMRITSRRTMPVTSPKQPLSRSR